MLTGYEPLAETVTVGDDRAQTLQPKAGAARRPPVRGYARHRRSASSPSTVRHVGTTPLADHPIRPGRHRLGVEAERYVSETRDLDAEGGGNELRLSLELVPDWAMVTIDSTPAGATVLVGEEEVGLTPAEFELRSGAARAGTSGSQGTRTGSTGSRSNRTRRSYSRESHWSPSDGRVLVQSEPPGATLLVDGRFRGRTPVAVDLEPGRSFRLTVSEAGFRDAEKTIRLKSGEDRRETLQLQEITGVVLFASSLPDVLSCSSTASLPVPIPSVLTLRATPHRLEISKPDYVSQTINVTPTEGLAQRLQIRFALAEAELAAIPSSDEDGPGCRTGLGASRSLHDGNGSSRRGAAGERGTARSKSARRFMSVCAR